MRAQGKLDVVYTDVCGPFDIMLLGRNKYLVSFVNELNIMTWVYILN